MTHISSTIFWQDRRSVNRLAWNASYTRWTPEHNFKNRTYDLHLLYLVLSCLPFYSKMVMIKPVTLPCGHSACLSCYTRKLEIEKQRGSTRANSAECRVGTFGEECLTVNYAMHKITSGLHMKCLNENCDWSCTLNEAADHNRSCPRRPQISCTLGCGEKLPW